MQDLGTILGVWAHPDDENYVSGGIMADAARRGSRVVCVTATRGEEGSWDHERWPPDQMARIRTAELEETLAILGVTEHHWLDYHDGGCDRADPNEATAAVEAIMEEVRPHTVLTFGPDGMTGHPDHIAVSAWTTAAFSRVAAPARLHYATTTPEWVEKFYDRLQQFDVYAEGTPPITARSECSIHFALADDLLDVKVKAAKAQVSQIEAMLAVLGDGFFVEGLKEEAFRAAD
ncbi:MAG: PIG-L deacetylase family protein [Actinomycetota bacterium]